MKTLTLIIALAFIQADYQPIKPSEPIKPNPLHKFEMLIEVEVKVPKVYK
jgi:hypothetical protein